MQAPAPHNRRPAVPTCHEALVGRIQRRRLQRGVLIVPGNIWVQELYPVDVCCPDCPTAAAPVHLEQAVRVGLCLRLLLAGGGGRRGCSPGSPSLAAAQLGAATTQRKLQGGHGRALLSHRQLGAPAAAAPGSVRGGYRALPPPRCHCANHSSSACCCSGVTLCSLARKLRWTSSVVAAITCRIGGGSSQVSPLRPIQRPQTNQRRIPNTDQAGSKVQGRDTHGTAR
jgi:hypothetical protein